MSMISIAGLHVKAAPKYEPTLTRMKKYLCSDDCEPDIVIHTSDAFLEKKHIENPHLTIGDCEYIWLGASLFEQLPDHGAFMLHASAIVEDVGDGNAFLFSAPSGTGKSTHTSLWMKAFPEKKLYILNDDKPIIFYDDASGKYKAAGSPFSGTDDISENRTSSIKGICFILRGEKNEIRRISPGKAVSMILDQTLRPKEREKMIKYLDLIDGLLKSVPVYVMRCLPDTDAAKVSYEAMNGGAL
ncbi:MAG: hypothetical protein IJS94_05445 [Clostridia bacterium]|nr:hypothetical protein [Clostridia bacterium]